MTSKPNTTPDPDAPANEMTIRQYALIQLAAAGLSAGKTAPAAVQEARWALSALFEEEGKIGASAGCDEHWMERAAAARPAYHRHRLGSRGWGRADAGGVVTWGTQIGA